eukprot:scaffold46436_cov36-Prasinocladus_malaysianus.AAC.1
MPYSHHGLGCGGVWPLSFFRLYIHSSEAQMIGLPGMEKLLRWLDVIVYPWLYWVGANIQSAGVRVGGLYKSLCFVQSSLCGGGVVSWCEAVISWLGTAVWASGIPGLFRDAEADFKRDCNVSSVNQPPWAGLHFRTDT